MIKSKDDKKTAGGPRALSRHLGDKIQPIQMFCPQSEETRAEEIASDYQLTDGSHSEKYQIHPTWESASVRTWNHISKIASKANSTLGFLRENLKGCPS